MQWFLAVAEKSPAFKQYGEMIKVAVHTAARHTSLEPHLLYYGDENDLTGWLRERGVSIIQCQTSFANEIATLSCGEHEVNIRKALHGIFLRTELPRLHQRLQLDDRVLYTDCDIFFRGDVTNELATIDCEYFAVAPEFESTNYRLMNTGVMWMNLRGLRGVDAEFQNFMRQNLTGLQSIAWDQGAYREFFTNVDGSFRWEKLRPELNWKPYWGENAEAKIIHFHGPKPFQQDHIDSTWPEFKTLIGGSYAERCAEWHELLREAG